MTTNQKKGLALLVGSQVGAFIVGIAIGRAFRPTIIRLLNS